MRFFAAAVLFVLAVPLFAGCEEGPPKTALGYTDSAKRAYDLAMEEYSAHNWIEAQAKMRDVKRRYSYSKYARLAELRIADADYAQEKYPEAIREYKEFIHAHRSDNDDVAYARSRVADATFAQIPESVLMPAQEERDQASVVDAYRELKGYLADYPTSRDAPRIRGLLGQVLDRLVRHELYVARFYLKKDNYDATVARVEYALHNYSAEARAEGAGTDLEAEALLLLGETYLRMQRWNDARQAFETIVREYRGSPSAEPARNYLVSMHSRGV
jgi:outer membrane protein assembly factor BamD